MWRGGGGGGVAGYNGIWMDLARAHSSAKADLEKFFKRGVITQPPRSPDFNCLDAGIFSYLEKRQQEHGALSLDDIRASVESAFSELTNKTITRVCNAVRANFKVVIKKNGGNWYVEHRHKGRVPEETCCRCNATYTGDGKSTLLLCDHRGCMSGIHRRCLRRNETSRGTFYCDNHR